jgi:ribosomal protein L11 methyltransferase
VELAPELAAKVAPGGVVLLSGLLHPQEDEVRRAYEALGLAALPGARQAEWSLVALERPRRDRRGSGTSSGGAAE